MIFKIPHAALLAYLAITAVASISATASVSSTAEKLERTLPRLVDNRIVGGTTAHIARHPHQISMRYKSIFQPNASYNHRCGGSIIAANLIVTAAHCVLNTVPSSFQIVAGTDNRQGGDGYITRVQEIIVHENYNPNLYSNDIAVMVLNPELPLNNFTLKAIELIEEQPKNDAISVVTGWGTTTQGGYAANKLQEVSVPIVSNDICYADYEGFITDDMLCAGVRGVGGKDACQGDSGGPLLYNGKLAGIVSWGYGCAQPLYPGVYSNVAYLRPWVLDTIKQLSQSV